MDSSHGRGGSRGGHPRKTPGPRPSIERTIERTVPLHKAEKAWKPEKKLDSLPEEEAKRLVMGCLLLVLFDVRTGQFRLKQ